MTDQLARVRRVIKHLEQRTEARGCTPAEAKQARERIAALRKRYGQELRTPQGAAGNIMMELVWHNGAMTQRFTRDGKPISAEEAREAILNSVQSWMHTFFGVAPDRQQQPPPKNKARK